jgi:iron complex transport system substrate-binding protein
MRRMPAALPQRIVCLTEEPTEVLYALGLQDRIVGISGYTVRPPQARHEKPRVSAFTSAKVDKILALAPDLAIGFSDMQADIAAALIKAGDRLVLWQEVSRRPGGSAAGLGRRAGGARRRAARDQVAADPAAGPGGVDRRAGPVAPHHRRLGAAPRVTARPRPACEHFP